MEENVYQSERHDMRSDFSKQLPAVPQAREDPFV
jgi:hypothetical protein